MSVIKAGIIIAAYNIFVAELLNHLDGYDIETVYIIGYFLGGIHAVICVWIVRELMKVRTK